MLKGATFLGLQESSALHILVHAALRCLWRQAFKEHLRRMMMAPGS